MTDFINKEYFTLGRTSQQIIRDGSFPTRREHLETQLLNHHITENNIAIQSLLRKLHALYIHEKIPDFYSYFFWGQLINTPESRIQDSITRQLQLLKTKQNHFAIIMKTVNARQSCLKSLNRCLVTVKNMQESVFEESQDQTLISQFGQEIKHYRQLTALVLEQIKQWKDYLLSINPQVHGDEHIAFFYHNEDYLFKMLSDIDFIPRSYLSSKVNFSHKQDPFLLRPHTQNPTNPHAFYSIFVFSEEERERYLTCLKFMADERQEYLRRKISVREERIKQIQRAYQSKNVASKILLTRAHKKQKDAAIDLPLDFVQQSRVHAHVVKESPLRSKSLSDMKLKDFLLKGEKIRQIKEMKIGEPMKTLINPKKFIPAEHEKEEPLKANLGRSISLSILKKTSPGKMNRTERAALNNDFEGLLREKQLQIIEGESRRTFSSVRLKDRLSERKALVGQEGAQQLQKILDQLDHAAPQVWESALKRPFSSSRLEANNNNSQIKSRIISGSRVSADKTLLQHNEEAMVTLRHSVMRQMEDHEAHRERIQKQKAEEREQMQKLIREKLEKETLESIGVKKAKWVEGRDVLAHQMGKKQLFGYADISPQKSEKLSALQQELKKEMQLKWLRQVQQELGHRQALAKHEQEQRKQNKKRQKQVQVALSKQQQEKRFQEIEKEQRLKATEAQLKKEQQRQRELEQEMEQIVMRQKLKLEEVSVQQKQQLQTQMKQAMKSTLLNKLRREKSLFTSELKQKAEHKKQEQQHRAEVRKQIEASFEIEKQLERQRQRDQKKRKVRLVAQKMQHIEQEIEKQQAQKGNTKAQEEEINQLKKSLASSLVDPLRPVALREESKKRMRQDFEIELFSFNRERQTTTIQDSGIVIHQFKDRLDNEENLNSRMAELEKQIKEDQAEIKVQQAQQKSKKAETVEFEHISLPPKRSSLKAVRQLQSENTSEKFARFSQKKSVAASEAANEPTLTESDLKKMGVDMSPVEYMMYIKKKAAIDAKKVVPATKEKKQKDEQERRKILIMLEQFQIMEHFQNGEDKQMMQVVSVQEHSSDKNKSQVKQSEVSQSKISIKQAKLKESKTKQHEERQLRHSKKKQEKQDLEGLMKLTVHSKMKPKKVKRFVTSDDQSEINAVQLKSPVTKTKKLSKKPKKQSSDSSDFSVNEQTLLNKKKKRQSKEHSEQMQQPQKPIQAQFKRVDQQDLDHYLTQHFKKLSKLIRKLNLFKKDELLKMLTECKSIAVVEVSKGCELQGIVFLSENENKPTLRSLNIMHLGAYTAENTINVILKVRDLLFSVDPCSEITYSVYYNKEQTEQNNFIKQLEKRFDPYGAIFQKKINNQQIERKHVMRRMIGQTSSQGIKDKAGGQIKWQNHLLSHEVENSLGLELGLTDLGCNVGGWTLLSLFLSKYGSQEQIAGYLVEDVKEQNKNIKYLSKMSTKLKNNTVRDIEYFQFQNPFEANVKLIEQGVDIVKCDPKLQESEIPLKWMKTAVNIQLTLPFTSAEAVLKLKTKEFILKYLRFKCGKGSKVVKLKSSIYSSQVTVIPCKPSNYKILITEATELDSLKEKMSLDLYIKLLLANADQHTLSADQHIWIPQFESALTKSIAISEDFGFKTQFRDKVSMLYTQYTENGITYTPSHKDIFVTPPFIIAVLNSEVERLTESSPIFIQRIDLEHLAGVKDVPKPEVQSDF